MFHVCIFELLNLINHLTSIFEISLAIALAWWKQALHQNIFSLIDILFFISYDSVSLLPEWQQLFIT